MTTCIHKENVKETYIGTLETSRQAGSIPTGHRKLVTLKVLHYDFHLCGEVWSVV